ncbi:hypothetical protein A2125_00095 [Candidatus Woesebacteria bacterium GWB1_43_5]|uniref:HIT domain-containing protein n=1 Tax=Candidatus Woesebacteria bacterium GWB1_43_5 TaxID=1802474 RepID=A0A1F7WSC2_9BACT|nr:MAG: hypothetical protein A2125_00095 [Candidatus Woesebacteria bacterium GWB1_43_5]
MDDCIFCKIAKGEALAKIRGSSKNAIAFDSIDPVSEHHILIIPKMHIESFLDLEKDHAEIFMEMAQVAQKVIDGKKIAGGYKLVINGGKYQAINHFHWHLLGGKPEDESDVLNKT